MSTAGIGLVLLAAGSSRRMGTPKQLLTVRGQTLVRRAATEAVGSGCRPIIVVLGADARRVSPEVSDLPVRVVINTSWESGMGSSIRCGVWALIAESSSTTAVVVMACDQPYVDASVIRSLTEGYARGKNRIVAASYDDVCGIPVLFDRSFFSDLSSLNGETGARSILDTHRDELFPVAFPAGAFDVDTPEDFARLEATELRPLQERVEGRT